MAEDVEDTTDTPEDVGETMVADNGHKLLNQTDTHYEIQDPSGSSFKVAKDGVDGSVRKKIESLPQVSQESEPKTASGLENGFSPEDLANIDALTQKRVDAYTPQVFDPVTGHYSRGEANPYVVQQIKEDTLNQYMKSKQTLSEPGKNSEFSKWRANSLVDEAKNSINPTAAPVGPVQQGIQQASSMQGPDATTAEYSPTGQAKAAFAPVSDLGPTVPQGTQTPAQPDLKDSAFEQMKAGLGRAETAVQDVSKAQETLAQQSVKAYEDQQKQLANIQAEANKRREQNYQRMDEVRKQVLSGQIDPQKFWSSKSTLNQIGSAIAIALGGIGGGLSGRGGNMALDVINKQIDQDIDSQKTNLSQKNNSLRLLMEEGHDINTAESIQRSNQLAATAAQIQKYMAQSQAPQARLNGELMLNQIHQQAIQLSMQQAQYQVASRLGAGQPLTINPEMIQDEKLRERLVRLPNGQYAAANRKEDVEPVNTMMEKINPIYSELDKLDSIGKKALHGALSPKAREEAEAIKGRLAILLTQAEGIKRFNPQAAEALTKGLKDPSNWHQILTGGPQTKDLKEFLMNQTMSTLGQRLMNFRRPPEIKSAKPAGE